MLFLGYSNLHKGFKCLYPAERRIYISRDVVFDENSFPFSSLQPNVGARLRNEIALLPPSLLSPNASFGDALLRDQYTYSPVSTNALPSTADHPGTTEKKIRLKMVDRISFQSVFLGDISCTHKQTTPTQDTKLIRRPLRSTVRANRPRIGCRNL
jgi:hypothetical protein